MALNDRFKRIVVPAAPQKAVEIIRVDSKPELGTLLDDALSIYQTEILKMKQLVNKGNMLSPQQANVLQGYVKSLVSAAKEIRERDQKEADELGKMSDEEMLPVLEAEIEAIKNRVKKVAKS